jgi:hypothetical protein
MSRIEPFLLGVIATMSVVAGAYFVKFWRQTRDPLFLSFAVAFLVEALTRTLTLSFERPSEGKPGIYLLRLLTHGLILLAILRKNRRRG